MRSLLLILMCLAAPAWAQTGPASAPASRPSLSEAMRFTSIDVYVDSGDRPLAAYQFELIAPAGQASIVGIEGGEHAAYKDAPYYDPAAMSRSRVIVAAFSTASKLPVGKTRVARIHVAVPLGATPAWAVKLIVAGEADGQSIPATVSFSEGASK